MSGSSRAERKLSRCSITMDSGMNIEWESDSFDAGMRHHQEEERGFLARIDAVTPAIEVVLDELETRGHSFLAPADRNFSSNAQCGETGMPIVGLSLACTPRLEERALTTLVERIATLINSD